MVDLKSGLWQQPVRSAGNPRPPATTRKQGGGGLRDAKRQGPGGRPGPCRFLLLVAIIVTGLATAAQAQPESRILVLGVVKQSQEDPSLRGELVKALSALQLPVLDLPDLTEADRLCQMKSRIASLGRAAGVTQIMVASLSASGQQVKLYLHRIVESEVTTDMKRVAFASSWPETLRAAAKMMFPSDGSTVRPLLTGPAAPTGQAGSQGSSPTGQALGEPSALRPWRLGLGISLASLGIASLAVGIVASAKHGSEGPMQCPSGTELACRYDLTPLFAPAYALATAASVASVLTFTLPPRRSPQKESPR